MDLTARFVIVPMALASLLTGLILSLGTPWGLFRHYWVLAKLALTVFATIVLLGKMELIGSAARLAAEAPLAVNLYSMGVELAIHAAGGLLVLFVPTILSIYKPRGMTSYGRRLQRQQPNPSKSPRLYGSTGALSDANAGAGNLSGSNITITLRRSFAFGIVLIVVAAHLFLLHMQGMGLGSH
jgi:hypothetical protein